MKKKLKNKLVKKPILIKNNVFIIFKTRFKYN